LTGLATEIKLRAGTANYGRYPVGNTSRRAVLSHSKRGVHTDALLEVPSISLFDRFWQAAEGKIRLMTVAPELPGAAELIAHATALGVALQHGTQRRPGMRGGGGLCGWSAFRDHTFNAMRAIDHREPGLGAYVLDKDSLCAEIICDGIHVDPLDGQAFLQAKERGRIILVTDGMSATGMPDGTLHAGRYEGGGA